MEEGAWLAQPVPASAFFGRSSFTIIIIIRVRTATQSPQQGTARTILLTTHDP